MLTRGHGEEVAVDVSVVVPEERLVISTMVSGVCVCACVCVLMYVLVCKSYHIGQTLSNTLRLLASVRHYVNLQCLRESGSVIVLFAAMWLFFCMLPHHVLY